MNRTKLIQSIIDKFAYTSYLEIGCRDDQNFNPIRISKKVGVDPVVGGTYRMTSDEFFVQNTETFDIVFIDGLHESEQVNRDINHSLKYLNPNGTIVMHDCDPYDERAQEPYTDQFYWNGDVWKSFVIARQRLDIDAATANFDFGCGILRARPNQNVLKQLSKDSLNYNTLLQNKQEWLNLKSYKEIMLWI